MSSHTFSEDICRNLQKSWRSCDFWTVAEMWNFTLEFLFYNSENLAVLKKHKFSRDELLMIVFTVAENLAVLKKHKFSLFSFVSQFRKSCSVEETQIFTLMNCWLIVFTVVENLAVLKKHKFSLLFLLCRWYFSVLQQITEGIWGISVWMWFKIHSAGHQYHIVSLTE